MCDVVLVNAKKSRRWGYTPPFDLIGTRCLDARTSGNTALSSPCWDLLATMRRVVNYHSSWARQQQVELFDASGNSGFTAGRGFNLAGGAPGGATSAKAEVTNQHFSTPKSSYYLAELSNRRELFQYTYIETRLCSPRIPAQSWPVPDLLTPDLIKFQNLADAPHLSSGLRHRHHEPKVVPSNVSVAAGNPRSTTGDGIPSSACTRRPDKICADGFSSSKLAGTISGEEAAASGARRRRREALRRRGGGSNA
ncbi:hypothetical protein F511_31338 [Dorcoceras hygrometricum]|uniref:Uncharacterized protein n=1 Tax=Dorcoceras hygrometricum TaxID=472368 RepID=A0A2Z7AYF9_9LAMI|nr:hypothetical protein F511_31338 [Dorcoceras hygrometricum]